MQGGQLAAAPAPAAAPVSEAAELAFVAAQRNEQLRRILLPLLGGATLLLAWWALVEIFQVKPFIAPAPQVVARTLYDKFGLLMSNLAPTAMEAIGGFVLGNFVAILTAAAMICSRRCGWR